MDEPPAGGDPLDRQEPGKIIPDATRYCLTIAYDGTDFAGWQTQSPQVHVRTVQGVLTTALSRLNRQQPVVVHGAGRTDAGVHALGQVASFDLGEPWKPEQLRQTLNRMLPADVRILAARVAPRTFHARRGAVSKLYRYTLDIGPLQWPLRRRFAAHLPQRLDEAAVVAAAAVFLGRHDFAALAAAGGSVKTTVRTVARSEARVEALAGPAGDLRTLVYEVEADGFLRKMVRNLVGGLMAVGSGKLSAGHLGALLAERNRRLWPAPAPACGLTLVAVRYPPG